MVWLWTTRGQQVVTFHWQQVKSHVQGFIINKLSCRWHGAFKMLNEKGLSEVDTSLLYVWFLNTPLSFWGICLSAESGLKHLRKVYLPRVNTRSLSCRVTAYSERLPVRHQGWRSRRRIILTHMTQLHTVCHLFFLREISVCTETEFITSLSSAVETVEREKNWTPAERCRKTNKYH